MTYERINNLDILRALAALMVCLFHFEREGGFTGIEWF
jgi:peptidoglycan/LPS O-acetylase OafA/YrhL